jgi:hypothetical protein
LNSLYDGVEDISVQFQGGIGEARCIEAGTAKAFEKRIVVATELDFFCWIDTAETKEMMEESGNREHVIAFGTER